jgi:predicted acyltransferase
MQPLTETKPASRLLALDFMRGFIMVLLALESAGLYENMNELTRSSFVNPAIQQFFHHPWNGLNFWDLIQPGFMFIAGTAMAYSLTKQFKNGAPWSQVFIKVLKRSWWLFFWGVLDYAVEKDGSLSFELWDVLTQLSFTTLITFLVFKWSYRNQILFCIFLLLLTEALYRFTNIQGFDQPFTDQQNFGNYIDLLLMNQINKGGWVAINCIPTAVHTIAGAIAGKLLIQQAAGSRWQAAGSRWQAAGSRWQAAGSRWQVAGSRWQVAGKKNPVVQLVIWGVISLIAGFALDLADITPIIKRIATSSFTLASLGWCLLGLAFVYWWIDVLDHKKYLKVFTIVGMNSLFIYVFFEIVGSRWFNGYVSSVTNGLMSMASLPEGFMMIATPVCIFALEWGMCYFLYKKKIFFKA